MSRKYSFESIKRLIQDPSLVSEAWRLFKKDISEFPLNVNRRWYSFRFGGSGEEFIDEDWDNLIILDAARPEFLQDFSSWDGVYDTRTSPGSFSREFIEEQFNGRQLHDTVYISANPFLHDIDEDVFHSVVNLLETHWDGRTVPPENVTNSALSAVGEYPNKRLIIHYMQPHFPFLGPAGDGITGDIGKRIGQEKEPHPWYEQMSGAETDHETLVQAYRENHEIVVGPVQRLLDGLDGKSVITADHANLIGERGFPFPIRQYGHPMYFPHPKLTEVPWITINGDRRDIESDPPVKNTSMDESTVEDRLSALGYAD